MVRELVNGALLAHTIGRNVSIIGVVSNINSKGTAFEIKTTDNIIVTINLTSPLNDMLEGYVKVNGKCVSKNVINADEYDQFSAEQTDGFDTEGHNNLCALLQQIPDVYKIC